MPTVIGNLKYDWYQTESHVIITVLVKNLSENDVKSQIGETSVALDLKLPNNEDEKVNLELFKSVKPAESTVKVTTSKVEIKLKKAEACQWSKLEGKIAEAEIVKPASAAFPSGPSRSKDWDKIVNEFDEEEKAAKTAGEGSVDELFREIYEKSDDATRRAMNKSYSESAGTVLSTNWGEVGKETQNVKPPDGVEYKKWDA